LHYQEGFRTPRWTLALSSFDSQMRLCAKAYTDSPLVSRDGKTLVTLLRLTPQISIRKLKQLPVNVSLGNTHFEGRSTTKLNRGNILPQ
jgi:hypothetical protein